MRRLQRCCADSLCQDEDATGDLFDESYTGGDDQSEEAEGDQYEWFEYEGEEEGIIDDYETT